MACHVYSNNPDTHVTFWVTHKNNQNVRQIITLARSGLFMEYCCLVLGVCVWGVQQRDAISNWFPSRRSVKGSLKPFLGLWLVGYTVETLNEAAAVLLIICSWKNNICPWIWLNRVLSFSWLGLGYLGKFWGGFSYYMPSGGTQYLAGQGAKSQVKCTQLIDDQVNRGESWFRFCPGIPQGMPFGILRTRFFSSLK